MKTMKTLKINNLKTSLGVRALIAKLAGCAVLLTTANLAGGLPRGGLYVDRHGWRL